MGAFLPSLSSLLLPRPCSVLPPSLLHFIRFFPAAAVIGTTDFLSPPSPVRSPARETEDRDSRGIRRCAVRRRGPLPAATVCLFGNSHGRERRFEGEEGKETDAADAVREEGEGGRMEDCKKGRKPVQDSRNADKGRARACAHSAAIIVTFSTAEERRTSSQSCVPHLSVCVCLSWPLCVATVWSVGQTNKNGSSQGHRQRGGGGGGWRDHRPPNPLAQSLPPKMEGSGQRGGWTL